MNDPLSNIADISKSAAKLTETLSKGVGGIFAPSQIKRISKAKIDVEKAAFEAEKEILQTIEDNPQLFSKENILVRAILKNGCKIFNEQLNIDSLLNKAYEQIEFVEVNDEEVEVDWLSDFFEKVKNISEDESQLIWAQILAGEVAKPGSFSMSTLNLLKSMNKKNAEKLTKILKLSINGFITFTDLPTISKFGLTVDDFVDLQDLGWIGQHDLISKTIAKSNVAFRI